METKIMRKKQTEDVKVTPDSKKTFEQLICDNENFVYKVVNDEFKNYSWNIKQELYSAR